MYFSYLSLENKLGQTWIQILIQPGTNLLTRACSFTSLSLSFSSCLMGIVPNLKDQFGKMKSPSSGPGRHPVGHATTSPWPQDTDSAPPPTSLYSLPGKGWLLLTAGKASREVAGCAEAEEVQAAAAAPGHHTQRLGPTGHAPGSAAHPSLGLHSLLGRDAHVYTHPARAPPNPNRATGLSGPEIKSSPTTPFQNTIVRWSS